jgi:hypothetical protein
METQAPAPGKKLIFTPQRYYDPAYRQCIYDQWMAEVMAARAALGRGVTLLRVTPVQIELNAVRLNSEFNKSQALEAKRSSRSTS